MFSCGYRTLLIFLYCLFCAVSLRWTWQPAVGVACAVVLAHLDVAWTRAMWPKAPSRTQNALARVAFACGSSVAILAVLTDVTPSLLEPWSALVFPGPYHASVLRCLGRDRDVDAR